MKPSFAIVREKRRRRRKEKIIFFTFHNSFITFFACGCHNVSGILCKVTILDTCGRLGPIVTFNVSSAFTALLLLLPLYYEASFFPPPLPPPSFVDGGKFQGEAIRRVAILSAHSGDKRNQTLLLLLCSSARGLVEVGPRASSWNQKFQDVVRSPPHRPS